MLQVCLSRSYTCFIICCKHFIWMLRMCCDCFQVFFSSVSYARFKCFICLQTYVVSVVSGCFKSRSGVTSLSSLSAASLWCLFLAFCCLESLWRGRSEGRQRRCARGRRTGRTKGLQRGRERTLSPSVMRVGTASAPLVLYFTWDTNMVPLVGHDATLQFGWLEIERCVQTRCRCRTSGR
jgi:hypothetical protein